MIVHNSMPCNDEEAIQYFNELFLIWFDQQNVPVGFDIESVK